MVEGPDRQQGHGQPARPQRQRRPPQPPVRPQRVHPHRQHRQPHRLLGGRGQREAGQVRPPPPPLQEPEGGQQQRRGERVRVELEGPRPWQGRVQQVRHGQQ